ncbi:MAG: cyclic nucleotide-binding domain-containing protein [Phycisphaera sp.]|nr:cyclic nucleotide-binding domain-containing protein [Phycisphaera sp.]
MLDKLQEKMPIKELQPGEVLLEQDQNTGKVYILIDGTVEILRDGVQITTVDQPGAPFGEISALINTPHTATVKALTPVMAIEVDDFRPQTAEYPELPLYLAETLANRLIETNKCLAELHKTFDDLINADDGDEAKKASMRHAVTEAWTAFGDFMRTQVADF